LLTSSFGSKKNHRRNLVVLEFVPLTRPVSNTSNSLLKSSSACCASTNEVSSRNCKRGLIGQVKMIDSNILKIYSIGKYITAQTATEATGYNLQYLRRLLRVGKITGVKIGQVWLIEFDSLKAYLKLNNDSVDKRCGPKKFRSKQCILI